VSLIGEPVKHSLAQPGVSEDLRPFRERQVGGHDYRSFFSALSD